MTRRAFTLVELVVVVGIIVLLVGITVTVSVSVVERAEVRRTERVLDLLGVAVGEWEVNADRKLTWGEDDVPLNAHYDIQKETPHVLVLPQLLDVVTRSAASKDLVANIEPSLMYVFDTGETEPRWISDPEADDPDPFKNDAAGIYTSNDLNGRELDGMVTMLDSWDTPIRVIHPGRRHDANVFGDDSTTTPDLDGTVYLDIGTYETGLEQLYGVAVNRQLCFVSAGPDGKFGDLSQPTDSALYQQAQDNIRSYEVIQP